MINTDIGGAPRCPCACLVVVQIKDHGASGAVKVPVRVFVRVRLFLAAGICAGRGLLAGNSRPGACASWATSNRRHNDEPKAGCRKALGAKNRAAGCGQAVDRRPAGWSWLAGARAVGPLEAIGLVSPTSQCCTAPTSHLRPPWAVAGGHPASVVSLSKLGACGSIPYQREFYRHRLASGLAPFIAPVVVLGARHSKECCLRSVHRSKPTEHAPFSQK